MNKLRGIIEEHLDRELSSITEATLLSGLCEDSLELLDLIFIIEDAYDVTIENAHSLLTVSDLLERLNENT